MSDMTVGAVRQSSAVRWLPDEPFAHLDDIHHRTSRGLRRLTCASSIGGAVARELTVVWNGQQFVVHGRIPTRVHAGTPRRCGRRAGPVLGNKITGTLVNGVLAIHAAKARPCPAAYILDAGTIDGYPA
ncbi:hypothetical protein ACXJJ3_03070 [Kribbella sp. WER1]